MWGAGSESNEIINECGGCHPRCCLLSGIGLTLDHAGTMAGRCSSECGVRTGEASTGQELIRECTFLDTVCTCSLGGDTDGAEF